MNTSHEHEYSEAPIASSVSEQPNGQASVFQDAASFIESWNGPDANAESPEISQRTAVEEWARHRGSLIDPATFDSLEIVSESTSEHKVYYRASDDRAVKKTIAGVYGQIPIARNGRIERRNASPSEYLRRMALQIAVFYSDIALEGVSISNEPSMVLFRPPGEPSFVISQPWYEKDSAPSMVEIAEYLKSEGFLPDSRAYFGWFRRADGVVIVDAKPDNFIKTLLGLIPIDLQMSQFSLAQLESAHPPLTP